MITPDDGISKNLWNVSTFLETAQHNLAEDGHVTTFLNNTSVNTPFLKMIFTLTLDKLHRSVAIIILAIPCLNRVVSSVLRMKQISRL
jgi:hypothetical protein